MPFEEKKHRKLYYKKDDGSYEEIVDIPPVQLGFIEKAESADGKVEINFDFFKEYIKWRSIAVASLSMIGFICGIMIGEFILRVTGIL